MIYFESLKLMSAKSKGMGLSVLENTSAKSNW